MELWTISILGATLLYGIQHFLYKAAAESGGNGDVLVNIAGGTVAVLALTTLILTEDHFLHLFTGTVLLYACMNGLTYALAALSNFGALQRAPAAVVFPLNRMNSLLVLLVGVFCFHETIRPLQYAGIAIGLTVLLLISREQRKTFSRTGDRRVITGVFLALTSAAFTTLSMTAGKLLADTAENRFAYITCSYSLVFLFTLFRRRFRTHPRTVANPVTHPHRFLCFGLAIGTLNFSGYYLVLTAFGSGPISLSQAIFSSSIIIPVVLSRILFGERLTPVRLAAILLAVLSVVLISLA